jgi:hypothetical protein
MGGPTGPVAELEELVGEHLRSVATYSESGYDIHYIRPDVERAYSGSDIDRIHDELVIQGLSNEYLEELFHAGGELSCSVTSFEELVACHVAGSGRTGLFVAVDADAEVDMMAFIECCKRAVV